MADDRIASGFDRSSRRPAAKRDLNDEIIELAASCRFDPDRWSRGRLSKPFAVKLVMQGCS
jgi:hypothetical protein